VSRPFENTELVEQRVNATVVDGVMYEPHEYTQAALALLVAILKELRSQRMEN
jgi:hypothetical protein